MSDSAKQDNDQTQLKRHVGVVGLLHGHAPKLVGQAVAIPLATVAMFALNRTWTFAVATTPSRGAYG